MADIQGILIIQKLHITLRHRSVLDGKFLFTFLFCFVMSKLKDLFKKSVCACKLFFAYVKAIGVLVKAALRRLGSNGIHHVSFVKVGRKWYCEVPGFPKELFEHTMMVGGAAKLLEYYSRGDERIEVSFKIADDEEAKYHCGMSLLQSEATLTGGAFYKGGIDDEIWLCPVTLFLLGRYPKNILIYRIHKNNLKCPIYFE